MFAHVCVTRATKELTLLLYVSARQVTFVLGLHVRLRMRLCVRGCVMPLSDLVSTQRHLSCLVLLPLLLPTLQVWVCMVFSVWWIHHMQVGAHG